MTLKNFRLKKFISSVEISNGAQRRGFILLYTSFIVGVILVIVGVSTTAFLSEARITRSDKESLKAFYAADAGFECIRFYHTNYRAFDTTESLATYNCGVGTITTGFETPTAECVEHRYNYTLNGFSNDVCAEIEVIISPVDLVFEGETITICRLRVISKGKNSCTATGVNLRERTRWGIM